MELTFYICALVAILATLPVVTNANPVHALLYLVVSLLAVAGVFFALGAPFAGALEVIVYAGAIMVLFIFVIMLLNTQGERTQPKKNVLPIAIALPLLFSLIGVLAAIVATQVPAGEIVKFGTFSGGDPLTFGRAMFTRYLLPFEVTSVLILIAIVGAVVLAKKEI